MDDNRPIDPSFPHLKRQHFIMFPSGPLPCPFCILFPDDIPDNPVPEGKAVLEKLADGR